MYYLSVLVVNWFTRPKNERSLVRVVGAGNLEIASVRDGSILYLSPDNWKPAEVTQGWQSCHFSLLSDIPLS